MDMEARTNLKRTPETKAVCTRWYLPGGYDVHHARVLVMFFDDVGDAQAYADYWRMPPEMADFQTIERYDLLLARGSKNYADYKQRYFADFGANDEN